LGHTRLAIIDLSTGHQPMLSEDGSLALIFNGEIYNYLELRKELIKLGYRFRTTSDTEVILAAYEEWDTECVKHLNGMWAFALWDGGKRRLFCSRDRAGEKPFYYAVTDDVFVFGSEIKALFSYGIPKRINIETLDAYLCFTYVPGRETFFKGIYKLQPASSIVVNAHGVRESRYWEFTIAEEQEARTDKPQILESSNPSLKMRWPFVCGATFHLAPFSVVASILVVLLES
jgi:asparagine synthase (glutamine-hydrolysing)